MGVGIIYPPSSSSTLGYNVYTALITQDTVTPTTITVTVLKNTLGFTPSIARTAQGVFNITSTAGFTANKTSVFVAPLFNSINLGAGALIPALNIISTSIIELDTVDATTTGAIDSSTDQGLLNTMVEIRVYP